MELLWEHAQKVTNGHNPAAYHSPDNVLQVLYTDGQGQIRATATETPFGDFAGRDFTGSEFAAQDEGVQHLTLSYLPRMNIWAVWLSEGRHRMGVFLLKQEANKYLDNGSVSFRGDDPTTSLSLTLENPKGIICAEDACEVPPGTRISVFFRAGNSVRLPLGSYYLDRVTTKTGDPKVTITARNIIGKLLKDQTFDESTTFTGTVTSVLREILEMAGVTFHRVESVATTIGMEFPPNMSLYDGIQSVISTMDGWEIREDINGAVVIGGPAHLQYHCPAGYYSFHRGKDLFSREVSRDDREVYSRVCVHDRDFAVKAYQDVAFQDGWNLPSRKTLYVEVPEGTSQAEAEATAEHLANRLANVGIIESFSGPFRPHLQPGDAAEITEPGKLARLLGTITQVGLKFGRGGYTTDFTVDSGGVLRKPSLKDLIQDIGGKRQSGTVKRLE
jgi:hypothetical protein